MTQISDKHVPKNNPNSYRWQTADFHTIIYEKEILILWHTGAFKSVIGRDCLEKLGHTEKL